jgi:hypothetical protein
MKGGCREVYFGWIFLLIPDLAPESMMFGDVRRNFHMRLTFGALIAYTDCRGAIDWLRKHNLSRHTEYKCKRGRKSYRPVAIS